MARTKVVGGVVGMAVVLVGGTTFGFTRLHGDGASVAADISSSSSTQTPSTSTTTSTTTPPTTSTTSTTLPPSELGAAGPDVTALQQRLVDLRFWLPAVDGNYDSNTMHAVTAFQKANGLDADGVASPTTIEALANATRPLPRSTSGTVMEVDLTRQLLFLVADGHVQWVFDTSTGKVAGTTPVGDFTVYRQVNGNDRGPLGTLYRPKYFVRGVAVHGFSSVPARPASHGCVRVTNAAMDWLWANDAMPIGTAVSVHK